MRSSENDPLQFMFWAVLTSITWFSLALAAVSTTALAEHASDAVTAVHSDVCGSAVRESTTCPPEAKPLASQAHTVITLPPSKTYFTRKML